jgi:hypothetical protein
MTRHHPDKSSGHTHKLVSPAMNISRLLHPKDVNRLLINSFQTNPYITDGIDIQPHTTQSTNAHQQHRTW